MSKEIHNQEKAFFRHLSVTYKPTNSKEYQQIKHDSSQRHNPDNHHPLHLTCRLRGGFIEQQGIQSHSRTPRSIEISKTS